jgi:hypothetical protein
MQTHQLERMLRLANKTGGKLIITDSAGNRPVVILGLDEYEALLDASPRATRPASAPVPEKRVQSRQVERVEEDEADVTAMEEALMAVEESMPENIGEEPSIVPVKSIETEREPVEAPAAQAAAKDRPAPARLAGTASEFSEEQFYLEPL